MHNDLESKRQIPGRHPALLGGFIVEWVHNKGDSRFPLNVCQQPATMQWQTVACVCVILFSLISQVETKKEVFCRPGKHEHYVKQYGQCKKCDKCPPGWGYEVPLVSYEHNNYDEIHQTHKKFNFSKI